LLQPTPRRQGVVRLPTESRGASVTIPGTCLIRPPWRRGRCCTNVPRGCHAIGLDNRGFIEGMVSLVVEHTRRCFMQSAVHRWLDGVCGALFVGFGVRLAFERQ
jgi:hypothetical protein